MRNHINLKASYNIKIQLHFVLLKTETNIGHSSYFRLQFLLGFYYTWYKLGYFKICNTANIQFFNI